MKLFFIALFIPFFIYAQEVPNTIRVRATSNIFVPADAVKLSITLSCADSVPRTAYRQHKEMEAKLMALIEKYKMPDSLIAYSLLSFRPGYRPPGQPPAFQTSQEIIVRLKSVEDYANFQLELFENGFYNFHASFMTERIDIQKKEGYDAALKLAKYDAGLIADAMGKELGDIVSIIVSTTDFPYVDPERLSTAMTIKENQKDLTEIKQSIQIRTYIEAVFEIED